MVSQNSKGLLDQGLLNTVKKSLTGQSFITNWHRPTVEFYRMPAFKPLLSKTKTPFMTTINSFGDFLMQLIYLHKIGNDM